MCCVRELKYTRKTELDYNTRKNNLKQKYNSKVSKFN